MEEKVREGGKEEKGRGGGREGGREERGEEGREEQYWECGGGGGRGVEEIGMRGRVGENMNSVTTSRMWTRHKYL